VVHGLVGAPGQQNQEHWEAVPKSTEWFLGLPEVFRGLASAHHYFLMRKNKR
jgi:hypothetical protein